MTLKIVPTGKLFTVTPPLASHEAAACTAQQALILTALALAPGACADNSTEEASASSPPPDQPEAAAAAPVPAAPSASPRPAAPKAAVKDAPAPKAAPLRVEVPEGTEVSVFLIDSISTARNKADRFYAGLFGCRVRRSCPRQRIPCRRS